MQAAENGTGGRNRDFTPSIMSESEGDAGDEESTYSSNDSDAADEMELQTAERNGESMPELSNASESESDEESDGITYALKESSDPKASVAFGNEELRFTSDKLFKVSISLTLKGIQSRERSSVAPEQNRKSGSEMENKDNSPHPIRCSCLKATKLRSESGGEWNKPEGPSGETIDNSLRVPTSIKFDGIRQREGVSVTLGF
jgi:hypothetical protein